MENIIDRSIMLMLLVGWLMGIVISKGVTSCVFAVIFAPYSWYLVVEKIMLNNGFQ